MNGAIRAFVATRERIENFLDQHRPPFIAKVYWPSAADVIGDPEPPGSVALWYPR